MQQNRPAEQKEWSAPIKKALSILDLDGLASKHNMILICMIEVYAIALFKSVCESSEKTYINAETNPIIHITDL